LGGRGGEGVFRVGKTTVSSTEKREEKKGKKAGPLWGGQNPVKKKGGGDCTEKEGALSPGPRRTA